MTKGFCKFTSEQAAYLPVMTGPMLKTWLCLATHHNRKTGLCCPSYDVLCAETGYCRSKVREGLHGLIGIGWITVEKRSRGRSGGLYNTYRLRFVG